ncbi:enoyl-CoA hydratase/isomerase family protein [Hoyosella altamirensis]|uniref:2-(1,2-epoxy-1,2-dihydrophenyl)acetyl-CoA isomerase n=1 Tax=Hoyosella altamirensis TaxID=616997 RepID=A0A839RJF1_9ACTN|nr:enoyl-CoA hydratase-related protein [Hoyosella altamirensis]MBB3036358.1 2-(1,2-epoxy-1,2-dihydrophenyl)acetyl-CoA isomerase [Hoyosella altamirensis]
MTITVDAGVAHVLVAIPEKGQSLDIPGLDEAAAAIRADSSIRAILLTGGDGPNFCNGGDVKAFGAAENPGQYVRSIAEPFHRCVQALIETDIPVVAAVRGFAAGGGMSLSCAADIVVGGPSTTFLPAYPGIGYSTDGGLTWSLPRIVGRRRAAEILFTNRRIGSAEAFQLGLITQMAASDEDVVTKAQALAEQIARGSRSALGSIKRLLTESDARSLADQLAAETDAIERAADSADGREGVAAFLEKRKPNFEA